MGSDFIKHSEAYNVIGFVYQRGTVRTNEIYADRLHPGRAMALGEHIADCIYDQHVRVSRLTFPSS